MKSLEEYYSELLDSSHRIMFESFQTQVSFAHHLTLVSATLLGILVAFHPSPPVPRLHLWTFLFAVALLALSILLLLCASNAYTSSMRELHLLFRNELEESIQQIRPMRSLAVKSSTNARKLVSYALFLLSLAIIVLVVYTAQSII